MRITVCGGVKFAKQLVEIYYRLKELGHEPVVHENLFKVADGTAEEVKDRENHVEDHEIKRKHDYIRAWYRLIQGSDAILVCNFTRDGVENHVGGNTLMEMGFAHVNNKKVFLLNPIPNMPYTDEIKATCDVALNGDLAKIA